MCALQIFSTNLWLVFLFSFYRDMLNFAEVQLINDLFHRWFLCYRVWNLIAILQITHMFSLSSSRSLMVLCFAFSSSIHLELFFMKSVRSMSNAAADDFVCGCTFVSAPLLESSIYKHPRSQPLTVALGRRRWSFCCYQGAVAQQGTNLLSAGRKQLAVTSWGIEVATSYLYMDLVRFR